MNYTLDSEHHARKCLEELYPDYKIHSTPRLLVGADLAKLDQQDKRYFFGVLTVSPNVNAKLTFDAKELIKVDAGSQIIIMFSAASFVDASDVAKTPEGIFRGFEINVQSL